jgi:hypothetical protein
MNEDDMSMGGDNEESSDQDFSGWPTDGVIPDEVWEHVDEGLKKNEEKCFIRTKAHLDQQIANLEKILPSMCHLYMSRLNPFASFEDLSICLSLSTLCENILISRRETLGPQHLWQGWDKQQIFTIFTFLAGIKKAVSKYQKDSSNHMGNLDIDLWCSGLDKWKEQFQDDDGDIFGDPSAPDFDE